MHFTSARFGRCAWIMVWAWGGLAAGASAQSEYDGNTCGAGIPCADVGELCAPGRRPVLLGDGEVCRCVTRADAALGDPTFCCNPGLGCRSTPAGTASCVNVDGSAADICVTPDITLCADPSGVVSSEQARACFTPPGGPAVQPYWRAGDCDGDGVTNGQEVVDERDPCCDEGTDIGCCLAAFDAPAHCCEVTGAPDVVACCFEQGGNAATCCGGSDPVACCDDASDAVACCRDAGGAALECCALDPNPASCCFAEGGTDELCCALSGSTGSPACADAAMTVDAAVLPDADVRPDAGAMDAGPREDGGNTAVDAGSIGFGGGGGCRCAAQGTRAPSTLALLVGALALAIPSFRRRR